MLLQAAVGAHQPVGCTQLAREFDLDVTRVNRILGTFAYMGMLKRTRSRRYVAGPGVHVLAAMSLHGSQLIQCAAPHMKALRADLKAEVCVGVLWRARVTYFRYAKQGREPAMLRPGTVLMPAEESGIGRILMAQMTDEQVQAMYAECGDGTCDREALTRTLAKTRRKGYAMGRGGDTLAVPIGTPAIAGLALNRQGSPSQRIYAKEATALVQRLQAAAEAIAADMAAVH
ncbi:MAG: IclR family transcriptional regulator [Planctomycetota bacterium]